MLSENARLLLLEIGRIRNRQPDDKGNLPEAPSFDRLLILADALEECGETANADEVRRLVAVENPALAAYVNAVVWFRCQPKPTATTWVTKDLREIPVAGMDNTHLVNVVRFLRTKGRELGKPESYPRSFACWLAMLDELRRRDLWWHAFGRRKAKNGGEVP